MFSNWIKSKVLWDNGVIYQNLSELFVSTRIEFSP